MSFGFPIGDHKQFLVTRIGITTAEMLTTSLQTNGNAAKQIINQIIPRSRGLEA
jgi:hypothetical protein